MNILKVIIKPCCIWLYDKVFKPLGLLVYTYILYPIYWVFEKIAIGIGKVFEAIYDHILAPIGRMISNYIKIILNDLHSKYFKKVIYLTGLDKNLIIYEN
jgi:hypothetical protein